MVGSSYNKSADKEARKKVVTVGMTVRDDAKHFELL